jgi:hypothetical protein
LYTDTLAVFDGDDDKKRVKLSEEEQYELVHAAFQEWVDFSLLIQQKQDDALENWQHYLQNKPDFTGIDTDNEQDIDFSNIRTGDIASTVDGLHSQLCLAAFPQDASFKKAVPRNKFSKQQAQRYEKLTQEVGQKLGMLENAYLDIKQCILDGTSAVWHPFIRIEREKAIYTHEALDLNSDEDMKAAMTAKPTKSYKTVVEVEGTGFYPIPFEDWKIDPTASSLEKTPFLWRRWVYPEDIKDIEDFENVDDVIPYSQMFDDSFSNKLEKLEYNGINGSTFYRSHMAEAGEDKESYPTGMVCLQERFGDFYINGKFYRNHVLVYSNDRIFHYFGPNPYDHGQKPFSVASLIPVPGSLYGKTSITDAIPLANALDTLYNHALDTLSFNANGANTYNYNDTVLVEWIRQKRTVYPGALVPTSLANAVTPLPTNIQGLTVIDGLIGRTREMLKDITGGVPYATGGLTSGQDRTLGEVEILAAGTNGRLQNSLQSYEKNRLKPFVYQEFENFRQYMTESIPIDENGDKITPGQIKLMDFEFQITGSRTVLNKSRALQDMRDALTLLPEIVTSGVATLKPSGKQIDPMPIVEEILKALNQNTDTIITDMDTNAMMGAQNEPGAIQQANLEQTQGAMGVPTGAPGVPAPPIFPG